MNLIALPTPAHGARTDEALVALVRRGDEHAFAEIHARYREQLLGFATRLLGGSGPDAEDVVQDAFIRAHSALLADDRPIALRAWLYRIARNRALDLLRAPSHSRTAPDSDALDRMPGRGGDAHGALMRREDLRRVVDGLGALPERQRLALVASAVDGERHDVLAGRLGTTVPATKALVSRARTNLAMRLAA